MFRSSSDDVLKMYLLEMFYQKRSSCLNWLFEINVSTARKISGGNLRVK